MQTLEIATMPDNLKEIEEEAKLVQRDRGFSRRLLEAACRPDKRRKTTIEEKQPEMDVPRVAKITDLPRRGIHADIVMVIFTERDAIKAALTAAFAASQPGAETAQSIAAEVSPTNPIPTTQVLEKLFEKLPSGNYRDAEKSIADAISREEQTLEAIAKIFGNPEINPNHEESVDDLLDAAIAYFYGGKRELFDALYPGNVLPDPDLPEITLDMIHSAVPEQFATRLDIVDHLILLRIRAKVLTAITNDDLDALVEFLFEDKVDELKRYKNEVKIYAESFHISKTMLASFIVLISAIPLMIVYKRNILFLIIFIISSLTLYYTFMMEMARNTWAGSDRKIGILIPRRYKKDPLNPSLNDYLFYMNELRKYYKEYTKTSQKSSKEFELMVEKMLICKKRAIAALNIQNTPPKRPTLKRVIPDGAPGLITDEKKRIDVPTRDAEFESREKKDVKTEPVHAITHGTYRDRDNNHPTTTTTKTTAATDADAGETEAMCVEEVINTCGKAQKGDK